MATGGWTRGTGGSGEGYGQLPVQVNKNMITKKFNIMSYDLYSPVSLFPRGPEAQPNSVGRCGLI